MFKVGKERRSPTSASPVDALLDKLDRIDTYARGRRGFDFEERVKKYLEAAKYFGLDSQAVVDSCVDLAETHTHTPEITDIRQAKLLAWEETRQAALSINRPPIEVYMELDPVYFEAILAGDKTYEGRAYRPDSDKNYPDIRAHDRIRFRMSRRKVEFADDALCRGLTPDSEMICTVKEVYFAPTVHGMYQIPRFNGLGFQPMINGDSEILQLQRAAVYHTFPGYHELIERHGFLGIELQNPQLATAA